MTEPRRVLFVTLFNDPGSDRIVSEMGRLGAHCAVVGPESSFAASTRFARRVYPLPEHGGSAWRTLLLGVRLEEIFGDASPDMIVPLDDLAARALRDVRLYRRASPELRRRLQASLGAPEHFETVCSRQGFLDVAARLGLRTPRTIVVPSLAAAKQAAAALGFPVVLKREHTSGGGGVDIAHDEAGLERAFLRGWMRSQAKRPLQWIYGYRIAEASAFTLQPYVGGDLAFRVSASSDGVELEGADFVADRSDPWDTCASTRVRAVAQEEMREIARAMIAALKLSGLVSFDFILDGAGKAVLLELNARPIACGHLGRLFGHDVLSAALNCGAPASPPAGPRSPPPRVVALFPREIDRDPSSAALSPSSGVYHDVPWEDPEVVAAYASWLDRRHPGQRPVLRRIAS